MTQEQLDMLIKAGGVLAGVVLSPTTASLIPVAQILAKLLANRGSTAEAAEKALLDAIKAHEAYVFTQLEKKSAEG